MQMLFDTSVLVPAMVKAHPAHTSAHRCLTKAIGAELTFLIAAHSLAECYSLLTTLPLSPRIAPSSALHLLKQNVTDHAHLVALTAEDYHATLARAVNLSLPGGVVYDGLILAAAEKAGASVLLTNNKNDFARFLPKPPPASAQS